MKNDQQDNELSIVDVETLNLGQTLDHLFGAHQPGESALMPAKTLELLRHLESIYKQVNNEPKRSEVASLIDLSYLPINCDIELFSKMNKVIETYATLDARSKPKSTFGNLLSYLEFSRKRLFFHCEQVLASNIKFYVDQEISNEDRSNVVLLRKRIFTLNYGFNPNRPYFFIPKRVLKEGILTYMEQKLNGKFDSRIIEDKRVGVYYFEEDFTRLVTKVCKSVRKILDPIVGIYDLYIEDSTLVKQFDQLTLEWITNTRLCREILLDLEFIRSGSFQLLLKRAAEPKKKKNLVKSVVGCFAPSCV